MTNHSICIQGVFSVQHKGENGTTTDWTVAINPTIDQSLQRIIWHDGGRGRLVDYNKLGDLKTVPSDYLKTVLEESKEITELPQKITVHDSNNAVDYLLEPLTLENYNTFIKERISGHPSFETDDDLLNFFETL